MMDEIEAVSNPWRSKMVTSLFTFYISLLKQPTHEFPKPAATAFPEAIPHCPSRTGHYFLPSQWVVLLVDLLLILNLFIFFFFFLRYLQVRVPIRWPLRLVIVRHGQSEQNAALDLFEAIFSSSSSLFLRLRMWV